MVTYYFSQFCGLAGWFSDTSPWLYVWYCLKSFKVLTRYLRGKLLTWSLVPESHFTLRIFYWQQYLEWKIILFSSLINPGISIFLPHSTCKQKGCFVSLSLSSDTFHIKLKEASWHFQLYMCMWRPTLSWGTFSDFHIIAGKFFDNVFSVM